MRTSAWTGVVRIERVCSLLSFRILDKYQNLYTNRYGRYHPNPKVRECPTRCESLLYERDVSDILAEKFAHSRRIIRKNEVSWAGDFVEVRQPCKYPIGDCEFSLDRLRKVFASNGSTVGHCLRCAVYWFMYSVFLVVGWIAFWITSMLVSFLSEGRLKPFPVSCYRCCWL